MTPIEKLRELEAKADPGPWARKSEECEEYYGDWEHAGPAMFGSAVDADFIAALRNLAPETLAVLKVADAMTNPGIPCPLAGDTAPDLRYALARAMDAWCSKAREVLP